MTGVCSVLITLSPLVTGVCFKLQVDSFGPTGTGLCLKLITCLQFVLGLSDWWTGWIAVMLWVGMGVCREVLLNNVSKPRQATHVAHS